MKDKDIAGYIITTKNLYTLTNIKTRLNNDSKLDYDERQLLATVMESIIKTTKLSPYCLDE